MNNEVVEQERKQVQCIECGSVNVLEDILTERPVETAAAGEKGVMESGLLCPDCGSWLHVYFTTPRLRKFMKKLEAAKRNFQHKKTPHNLKVLQGAQKGQKKVFDAVQARLRPKLEAKSPSQIRAEMMIKQAMGKGKGTDEEE